MDSEIRDQHFVDVVLAGLNGGDASHADLLQCGQWAQGDASRLRYLRSVWPIDRLPIIGPYYCVSRLGQGASGVVFKALDLRDRARLVALKLLHFGSEEAEERFREREIEILRALDCPHVCRYLDSGNIGGAKYLAMELVEGAPLDAFLADRTRTFEEKLNVFARLCEVVDDLHAQGVIHRDLKPRHVLIDRRGQPWVVDLGLSAVRSGDWSTRVRREQTQLGRILGTVKYMSPEQAWGALRKVDRRTDIWSLGIMLYEMATDGDYPYPLEPVDDASGQSALLGRIQTALPKKPRVAHKQYAPALEVLISRCLVYEPSGRIDSAGALAADLRRCLTHQVIRTKRLPLVHRLRRLGVGLAVRWRVALWSASVCAIMLLTVGISWLGAVRWRAVGEDYGSQTRQRLAHAGAPDGAPEVLIAGIFDDSITAVPPLCEAQGIAGLAADIRTWRAAHGRMMEKLATARPRAVVWDYYFATPRPEDHAFVRGAQRLGQAGVPVLLAVQQYREDGTPDLSADLFEPIADAVSHGLILHRDMVAREGEFIISLRHGERVYPALGLATFAAVVHPECKLALDWDALSKTIRLIYHPRTAGAALPAVDRVGLTLSFRTSKIRLATQPGDFIGCKAFPLHSPEYWQARTVPYERLLRAGAAELATIVQNKIIIVGDLRKPHPLLKRDRHRVRYGTRIVENVPGCYLLADEISGLLANRYLRAEPTMVAFLAVLAIALLACIAAPRLLTTMRIRSARGRTALLVTLLALGVLSGGVILLTRSRPAVYSGMFAMAAFLATAAGMAIESARNAYTPGADGGGSGRETALGAAHQGVLPEAPAVMKKPR